MSGRAAILGRIRRGLGRAGVDDDRRRAVAERLANPPVGVIPARGHVDGAERIQVFRRETEKVHTTVTEVADRSEVPASIADYLRSRNLPSALRMGEDARLKSLPWETAPNISLSVGPSAGDDLVGISHALAGVAETGTLVLVSGRDNPTTISFLPDTHIVVIDAADIAADFESVWSVLRARYGKAAMPRTVNMITGPSRSADIEQTMLLGAHGPRRLHIVIVGRPN